MTQSAIVTKLIDEHSAEITVTRLSACSQSCASCGGGCASENRLTVTALNLARASVGQRVTVKSQSGRVIGAAALVYILPLAFFFAGFALSAALSLAEQFSVICSLAAFLLGVGCVVLINRLIRPYRAIRFVIVDAE